MRWKADDEKLRLVLVLAPEHSWIILCDHGGAASPILAFSGFVSCQTLSPCCGRAPLVAPNPRTPLVLP